MRPYTEYADRMYLEPTGPAHIVPWASTKRTLCDLDVDHQWFGTGDWDETEHAAWLQLCQVCHHAAYPQNADEDPAVTGWRESINPTRSTS